MQHITEIVPELDTMPDWAQKAFKEGNFFNTALKMVDEQKKQLDALKSFVMHDENCSKTMIKRRCSCGLDAALNGEDGG